MLVLMRKDAVRPGRLLYGMQFQLCLSAGILAAPRLALAHAVLVSSTPQKNGAVSGPDITINLKYNSRVDGAARP